MDNDGERSAVDKEMASTPGIKPDVSSGSSGQRVTDRSTHSGNILQSNLIEEHSIANSGNGLDPTPRVRGSSQSPADEELHDMSRFKPQHSPHTGHKLNTPHSPNVSDPESSSDSPMPGSSSARPPSTTGLTPENDKSYVSEHYNLRSKHGESGHTTAANAARKTKGPLPPQEAGEPSDPANITPTSYEGPTAIYTPSAQGLGSRRYRIKRVFCNLILVSVVLCILVFLGIAVCMQHPTSEQQLSRGLQASGYIATRAYTEVSLMLSSALITVGGLYTQISSHFGYSRRSMRKELGSELGQTHTSLSEVVVAGNALYESPNLVSRRRQEAMGFKLPPGSLAIKPLGRFLNYSLHMDEDLLFFLLSIQKMATSTVRQEQYTRDELHAVQADHYFSPTENFWAYWTGTSTQESQLQSRLAKHIAILNNSVSIVDQKASNVTKQFVKLALITDEICTNAIEDEERFLQAKESKMSEFDWFLRAAVQMLNLPEPEEVATITHNVQLARSLNIWAKGVLKWLWHIKFHIRKAKTHVNSLINIIQEHGTVKWTLIDKDQELAEFLAQMAEGVDLLEGNAAAWIELEAQGYI